MRSTLLSLLYLWLAANLWLFATRGVPHLFETSSTPWGERLQLAVDNLPETVSKLEDDSLLIHFVSRRIGPISPFVTFSSFPALVLNHSREGRSVNSMRELATTKYASHFLWLDRDNNWHLEEVSR